MWKAYRDLWFVLMLGAALRVTIYLLAQPWTEQGEARILGGSGDIRSYHYLAHDLVLYGRYGGNPIADPYNLDPVIRPMGYALFVAFWYWLVAPKVWVPLFVQVLLSIASIALLYALCRQEFGETAARAASLMFAMWANGILFASTLMTETLYTFVMLAFLYGWSRIRQQLTSHAQLTPQLISSIALLGMMFGLSVYVRVSTVYFAPLFALAFWLVLKTLSPAQRLAMAAAFLAAALLTVAPYSLYMYSRYGTFRLTMVDDHNLLYNAISHALYGRADRKATAVVEHNNKLSRELEAMLQSDGLDPRLSNPFDRSPYFKRLAWRYYTTYPREIALGMLNGMLRFWWLPDRLWEIADEVLPQRTPARPLLIGGALAYTSLYHLVWLLLLLVGVRAVWATRRDWFWIFLVAALYFTLVTNSAGNDRYRMQVAAFAFPLVGLGAATLAERRTGNTLTKATLEGEATKSVRT